MGCGASKVVASVAEAPSKIKLDQDQHTKEDQHLEQHPSRATSAGKKSVHGIRRMSVAHAVANITSKPLGSANHSTAHSHNSLHARATDETAAPIVVDLAETDKLIHSLVERHEALTTETA